MSVNRTASDQTVDRAFLGSVIQDQLAKTFFGICELKQRYDYDKRIESRKDGTLTDHSDLWVIEAIDGLYQVAQFTQKRLGMLDDEELSTFRDLSEWILEGILRLAYGNVALVEQPKPSNNGH